MKHNYSKLETAQRRLRKSMVFGIISLIMFFPYRSLTWNISLFIMAAAGVAMASSTVILGTRKKIGNTRYVKLANAALWCTAVPFSLAVVFLFATGVLLLSAIG